MYKPEDKHCRECICPNCYDRGAENCISGKDTCEKCKNNEHTQDCPFYIPIVD